MNHNRRNFLWKSSSSVLSAGIILSTAGTPAAQALVKGNAPPPKQKKGGGDNNNNRPKCTNVDECQAIAERKEEELKEERELNSTPASVTKKGTKYRDLEMGDADKGIVEDGNEVTLFFKVLKLGKRSYDGISGEGTVVFSRGYGLEDDEKAPGIKSFVTTVGSMQNIRALNDAILGMNVGGIRRFSVLPQAGWEKPTKLCDGGPGGRGAGGELKTDYVVVPTATMVSTETCFDNTKIPFPTTYAEQRRMAQRFDQALIMEVQVLKVEKEGGLA
eukprot:CAMPEP_0178933978 /NCGR_PEP_ID=MMETSP0786-20121207/23607_1 /TAXON_ID=186022 /ORGANISM="Thalassionema frauenfeldii, Strain CCMP 1798" /LENGTH=273 /DNA_ID=CAMNT_0020611709 /DNA_START=221 /DNA_END=1042 /DNA_ORIENTATION=-